MLTSGVAIKTASQILGHSSISITADLYTHVTTDNKRIAAEQVGNTLFKKSDEKSTKISKWNQNGTKTHKILKNINKKGFAENL